MRKFVNFLNRYSTYQYCIKRDFSVTYGGECRFDNNNNRNCVESTECMDDGESLKCLCPESYRWDDVLNLCIHDDGR